MANVTETLGSRYAVLAERDHTGLPTPASIQAQAMASSPASSTSSSTRTDLDISTIRSIILAALAMYPQLQFDVIEPLRPTPLDGLSDIALHTALEQIKIKHPHVASTIEKKRQEFQTYAADDLSWVETETRDVLRQFAHFPPERHAEVGWRVRILSLLSS